MLSFDDLPSEVQQLREERGRYAAAFENVKSISAFRFADWDDPERNLGDWVLWQSEVLDALSSIDSGSALAEVKAQALEDFAEQDDLDFLDGVSSGRLLRVAVLARAEQIRKEGQSNG